VKSLWECVARSGAPIAGEFHGRGARIALDELSQATMLGPDFESLRGRSVMIATREQLLAAVCLLELDGVARRVILCPPQLAEDQMRAVTHRASADAVVIEAGSSLGTLPGATAHLMTPTPIPGHVRRDATEVTEWVLLTSGTTGAPKLVVHTLHSLAGTLPRGSAPGSRTVWSTFYDIRHYGGLQIYLRAVLGGSKLVLTSRGESTGEFLARAAAAEVTHVSGTPSHWRLALMSAEAGQLHPEYVRLSGEVADQAVLDKLHAAFPNARIAHAFASTEAGLAFDVDDGLAGFPAEFIDKGAGPRDLKVEDGTLRIRSPGNAAGYLGHDLVDDSLTAVADADGYVDTHDLVERVDDRYYFRGRKDGVINVGGSKVFPEEVESVLNADPRVRWSRVSARPNLVTGSVVVADVVLVDALNAVDADTTQGVKSDLLNACRRRLQPYKVPAILRVVSALEVTAAGKLVRSDA
jgi:acyl-coenzyme A synthetase/AMP-(fatty) acid ligase